MAYYRKRNGVWSYTVELPNGKDGERRQKYKGGFVNRRDAVKEATALENEIMGGEYIPDNKLTVSGLVEVWLQSYKPTVSVSSYVKRKQDTVNINTICGDVLVQNMTKRLYQEAIHTLANQKGFSAAKNTHGTFKMVLDHGVFLDIIKTNPSIGCKLPRSEVKEEVPLYLEKDELIAFLAEAKKYPLYYELFRFLAYSGCRIGEALALTWDDLEENNVKINKTLFYLTGEEKGLYVNPPKTKSSHRTIYIDDETLSIIQKRRSVQAQYKLLNNEFRTNYIFARTNGKPPYSDTVNEKFKQILFEAGISKKLNTHKLRHTHTSILAAAGVPLEEIQKRLGHGSSTMTREVYYHVVKERKTIASDLFVNYMKIQ